MHVATAIFRIRDTARVCQRPAAFEDRGTTDPAARRTGCGEHADAPQLTHAHPVHHLLRRPRGARAPATAGAVGLPDGYPRTIAGAGLADGVTVSRAQATMTLVSGNRVRVTAFTTATTTATGRRLVVAVARCSGSASSPVCKSAASTRVRLARPAHRCSGRSRWPPGRPARLVARHGHRHPLVFGPRSALQRRHASGRGVQGRQPLRARRRPDAVRRHVASSPRHALGHLSRAPAGVAVELVFFNSRTYAWTATSPVATTAITTIGYPNQPLAARSPTRSSPRRRVFDRTPSVGTAFETRAGTRTLLYAASIGGSPMFSMQVPIPAWTNTG